MIYRLYNHIATRVAVMYVGKFVEIGTIEDIFYHPEHPYPRAFYRLDPQ